MNTTLIIAVVEGILLLTLILLIVFRKIGRPLSEIEIEERKEKRRRDNIRHLESKLKKEEERVRKNEDEYHRREQMEIKAKSLKAPVTLLSYLGLPMEANRFKNLSLKDAEGKIVYFENLTPNRYRVNPCPTLYALAAASEGNYSGSVVVK